MLDAQLSEEERMMRDSARAFCQADLMPGVLMASRHEKFDREIMRAFGKMGFLGPTIEGYGCAGVGHVAYGLIAREVERVDSGAAAVAFAMVPVSVADLMGIADAGGIMPPKSTWFEPKLRDGLLTHLI